MSWIKYLFKYLIRHKWFVMLECFKRKKYWLGITHDLSKFLPSEFPPYAKFFYGKDSQQEYRESRYQSIETAQGYFQRAWQLHLNRNKHHWQNWINIQDVGTKVIFEMSEKYAIEMICDWIGAGRAQGYYDKNRPMKEVRNWYHKNQKKIILNYRTRYFVESTLGIL